MIDALGGIRRILAEADPLDCKQVYRSLNLDLTFHPADESSKPGLGPQAMYLIVSEDRVEP